MFRLNVRPLAGVLVLLLLVGIVSCVDNRYDLDRDIDMTISVGGDYLSVPGGSTDTTYLSKIITAPDSSPPASEKSSERALPNSSETSAMRTRLIIMAGTPPIR